MIMGMETIDKGTFEVGETVRIGYADQTHKDIDPKKPFTRLFPADRNLSVSEAKKSMRVLTFLNSISPEPIRKSRVAYYPAEKETASTWHSP